MEPHSLSASQEAKLSLKLSERYPGRFDNPSASYPQGSFKNRSAPDVFDGSYLEKDWANDKEGFFQSLLASAGIAPNGSVDAVGASQFFDALLAVIRQTSPIPAGIVGQFAMNNAPAGWLKANGQAVSRTTYAGLFSAIGTTYGPGNGSTTFNVPDLRAEFVRGLDDGRGVDAGRALGSPQAGSLVAYDPTVASPALAGLHTTGSDALIRSDLGLDIPPVGVYPKADVVTGTPTATYQVSEAAGVARPRNVALLYCIKT